MYPYNEVMVAMFCICQTEEKCVCHCGFHFKKECHAFCRIFQHLQDHYTLPESATQKVAIMLLSKVVDLCLSEKSCWDHAAKDVDGGHASVVVLDPSTSSSMRFVLFVCGSFLWYTKSTPRRNLSFQELPRMHLWFRETVVFGCCKACCCKNPITT